MSRYELAERLGVGATATVWRARDRRSGRNVCIKRLHPRLARDLAARDRLRQEAELATRVDHHAIPEVLDSHVAGDAPALVFPYVEGESLAVRLKRDGTLPPVEAARVAARIAEALAAVHAAGVVHRDVKPSNILLGANGEVRLLDFGIAEPAASATATNAGPAMTVGTLPYVGPQQLAGLPPAPSDDVWALGAVLYEMLSGRPPYEANTAPGLANAQAAPPPDLTDVPEPLARAALIALATGAAARPPAGALAATLDSWLSAGTDPDSPTAAMTSAIPVAQPPGRRIGRGGVLVAAAAVLVGLAVTSALAFGPDWLAAGGDVAPVGDTHAPINQPAFVPPIVTSPSPTVAPTTEPTATPVPRQASQPSSGSGTKPKADNSKPKPKNPGNSGGKGKGKKKGQR